MVFFIFRLFTGLKIAINTFVVLYTSYSLSENCLSERCHTRVVVALVSKILQPSL